MAENADMPVAESIAPAVALTENTKASENTSESESNAAAAPPPIANTAPADTLIITEPVADESPEQLDDAEAAAPDDLSDGPLQFPEKGSPKFVFDYRGRLWVEKKNRGFFKQLRRPQLPPDEPNSR